MTCFFFNDTATTEIYTLSLHDALPIYPAEERPRHEIERPHVHPHRLVPLLQRQLLERLEAADAGVVDEDVRGAALPGHEGGERVDARRVRHVAPHPDGVDAGPVPVPERSADGGVRTCADRELGSRLAQRDADGAPDPLRRSGYNGQRPRELHRREYTKGVEEGRRGEASRGGVGNRPAYH